MEIRTKSFERIDKFHWILYFKDEKRLGNMQVIISDIKRCDFCSLKVHAWIPFSLHMLKQKNKGKTYGKRKKKNPVRHF